MRRQMECVLEEAAADPERNVCWKALRRQMECVCVCVLEVCVADVRKECGVGSLG